MIYLPLTDKPEETFNISIFEIIYTMKQLWNTLGFWTIDIQDSDGNALVYGVKIVTQTRLLQQYPSIPFDLLSTDTFDPTRSTLNSFLLEVVERV